jgi:hypothetical protein
MRNLAILPAVLAMLWSQTGPDIDWASVLSAHGDPRVVISDCDGPDPRDPAATLCVTIPGAPKPNFGYAEIDNVSYGDIVGDGGTEAVVPIDSGGSLGVWGSLVYKLDASGAPQLVLAPGPGGNVTIDSNSDELVTVTFDDSCSSVNCTSFVRTGYKLDSGALRQQDTCKFQRSTADAAHPQGSCTPGN